MGRGAGGCDELRPLVDAQGRPSPRAVALALNLTPQGHLQHASNVATRLNPLKLRLGHRDGRDGIKVDVYEGLFFTVGEGKP